MCATAGVGNGRRDIAFVVLLAFTEPGETDVVTWCKGFMDQTPVISVPVPTRKSEKFSPRI